MSNAFAECTEVEKRGLPYVFDYIKKMCHEGQFVHTYKGNLAKELQEKYGDVFFNGKADRRVWCIEIKCEEENKHGNFFLETWSNKKWKNRGWLWKIDSDYIFYYFLDKKSLYIISLHELRRWAFEGNNFEKGKIYNYPEKKQRKRIQMNDTWGRCVPIETITREIKQCWYAQLNNDEWNHIKLDKA